MKNKPKIKMKVLKEDIGYSAFAINFPIVTQAETLDELQYNIREATELFLEDDKNEEKSFSKASIFMNYELPIFA